MTKKTKAQKLKVVLDIPTLTTQSSKTLMQYPDNDIFELIGIGSLNDRKTATLIFENKEPRSIKIDFPQNPNISTEYGFNYLRQDIEKLAKYLNTTYEQLLPGFMFSVMARFDEAKVIFITENQILLGNKILNKFGFSDLQPHSILHPDEAIVFIDLFAKSNKTYFTSPHRYANKGLWYLYSMKSKMVNFQLPWSIVVYADTSFPNKQEFIDAIESLGDRITDMLIAVDKIGMCYYEGSNNDTLDTTIYHLNYWIALFTGVLDSLGWITKYRYQITYDEFTKQGIRKRLHKKFLNLVFPQNALLSDVLDKNDQIINLMYNPRDIVIHRDRLKGTRYQNKVESLSLNLVKISKIFFNNIVSLSKESGDILGEWGHLKLSGLPHEYYLEPYRFVKKATEKLISFINEYLEQLNFTDYLTQYPNIKTSFDKSNKEKISLDFDRDIKIFEKYKLGF
jgi:hypothetical protein